MPESAGRLFLSLIEAYLYDMLLQRFSRDQYASRQAILCRLEPNAVFSAVSRENQSVESILHFRLPSDGKGPGQHWI